MGPDTIETTEEERNPVLEAINALRQDFNGNVQSIHNRLGYLERTVGKSDPGVSSELAAIRESFKGFESKMDMAVTANMSSEDELAYWKAKAQEPPKAESKPETKVEEAPGPDLAQYYQKYAEPDILDAAFDEGVISTNNADLVTEEDRRFLAAQAPRESIDSSLDGIQSYKRKYIRNIKTAAEKAGIQARPVAQTGRPIAKADPGKLRPIDLSSMTPQQVQENKERLFTQMGI